VKERVTLWITLICTYSSSVLVLLSLSIFSAALMPHTSDFYFIFCGELLSFCQVLFEKNLNCFGFLSVISFKENDSLLGEKKKKTLPQIMFSLL
jgi:hypothetical protein